MHRVDVHKGERLVILIEFETRDLAGDDLAKDAVRVRGHHHLLHAARWRPSGLPRRIAKISPVGESRGTGGRNAPTRPKPSRSRPGLSSPGARSGVPMASIILSMCGQARS